MEKSLAKGHRVTVRRNPKPDSGWISDKPITLRAADDLNIPALTTTPPPPPDEEPPPPPDEENPPPPPPDEPPPPDVEPPPATGAVVGYGAIAKGGTTPVPVRNLTELRAACGHSDFIAQLQNPIDLGGQAIACATAVTVLGKGEDTMLGNGWLQAVGDDVIVRNVAGWCGDERVSDDADTFNANGSAANAVERLLVDHCLFMWGIDVTVVFLNNIRDFTMQHTVIAEGLYLSKHGEAKVEQGGHSMGLNVTNIMGAGQPAPTRGTLFRNALINSADRNGRFMGADQIDLVENLLFGWQKTQGFHGAPKSMNVVNNLIKKGPNGSAVPAFALRTSNDEPKLYPDAVFVDGNVADGFTFTNGGSGFRTSPKHPLSVQTSRAPTLDEILSTVGPTDRGKQIQRLVADVKAGRSTYVNGVGKGGKEYTTLL